MLPLRLISLIAHKNLISLLLFLLLLFNLFLLFHSRRSFLKRLCLTLLHLFVLRLILWFPGVLPILMSGCISLVVDVLINVVLVVNIMNHLSLFNGRILFVFQSELA